ncbi:substrate-binding domain-containing protein [Bilophila wadsworthia]|uniref:sugar ABC transporter substrate-binding protein n=1 Tax=Bilophila wadsworthia TaxID=35833 RepID=UPI00242ACF95|nr:substrate-binding domain-containing protein [Bilophila wadsworthia]
MPKRLLCCIFLVLMCVSGCDDAPKPKIGISFGVGEAKRWPAEKGYMEERAQELGMEVETRFNKADAPKTQMQDCFELIDSGISVLILIPRDARKANEILAYAKKKNVKVISYARAVMGEDIDFFVGYDTYRIGQSLGLHLTEKTYKGNLAILKGDKNDFNSPLLYDGAMISIRPLVERGAIHMILDEYVNGWSVDLAKRMLTDAIIKNDYKIDAVFAHNDIFAGAAAEVVKELDIKNPVIITGMDAETPALKRLLEGTQDATVYMDLKSMAYTAVNEAYNMATKKKPNVNSEFDNESKFKIDAFLINGKLITRENIDRVLIAPGHFTHEQIYGN